MLDWRIEEEGGFVKSREAGRACLSSAQESIGIPRPRAVVYEARIYTDVSTRGRIPRARPVVGLSAAVDRETPRAKPVAPV